LHKGIKRLLVDVRFVPRLKHNLTFHGELEKKAFVFKGEQGMLKVLRGSMIVIGV